MTLFGKNGKMFNKLKKNGVWSEWVKKEVHVKKNFFPFRNAQVKNMQFNEKWTMGLKKEKEENYTRNWSVGMKKKKKKFE